MMKKAVIDMRSTDFYLRENLINRETYISTVNSNIETFNQHVKVNVEDLKAKGESTGEFITNLLKSYNVSLDTEFFWCIKTKKYCYVDG